MLLSRAVTNTEARRWVAYARYVRLGFGKSFFVGAREPLAPVA